MRGHHIYYQLLMGVIMSALVSNVSALEGFNSIGFDPKHTIKYDLD